MTDHYQTLGVAKNATPDEIKKAYRRLAAIHHPDKGGDTAEFQKVQAAYETLSDPQKKQEYDNPNPFGPGGNPFGGPGGFPGGFHFDFGGPGGFHFSQQGFDINDLFGGMFGHGGQARQRGPQMPSYRTTLWLSLEQAYEGSEQLLQIQGQPNPVKIQIPRGIEDGQSMRYDNLIKDSILIIEFRIKPHDKFQRNGPHLQTTQKVSVLDLIVGGTFEFSTISGNKLSVNVKPNTQPNTILRLQGEGMPFNNGFGDQMILLSPFIPAIIDSRIIDTIKQHK